MEHTVLVLQKPVLQWLSCLLYFSFGTGAFLLMVAACSSN